MNSKAYKWCAVPLCKNTSITTPKKVFVYVPKNKVVRDKWLQLAKRNPADVVTNSSIYFCEDHFDLPNDMENYMQYHLMGSVSQVRMIPGCIPTKFACQLDRKAKTFDIIIEQPKHRKMMMASVECAKKVQSKESTRLRRDHFNLEEITSGSSGEHHVEARKVSSKGIDKSIQVNMRKKIRSTATQTVVRLVNQMTSPLKTNLHSVCTSPFKISYSINSYPSKSSVNVMRTIVKRKEQSDSDISYTPPSLTCTESSHLVVQSSSDSSEMIRDDKIQEDLMILQCMLKKILKNPRFYIGIPKSCYYLLNLIQEQTNIPTNHILLCLKKIRLNSTFRELADDFAMDKSYASKIFFKNIPILASVIQPFIVKLDSEMNKRNLPMAFRHKYNKVSCIIDCMEIEVQKPSKALNQALSWSDYKKANTIKYLISYTPNGLVNYVSPGYGGRIRDTCLVESCDFMKCLQLGMCVMADRGFKHVETYLHKFGVELVRPLSVVSGAKLSQSEAETKQIASLRIHIERVIRRLREFNMIKPHACLNLGLVKVLDDVIMIACGLINLQDSLTK